MKKYFLLATTATALVASLSCQAAPASRQTTRPVYAWHTETDSNKQTGKFDYCLIKNMYDNGTLITLAENNAGVQRLAISFPKAKLKTGQHADLTLQIDNRDLFPVEAVSASTQILTIGLPQGLMDEMRKGQALHVRGPNDEIVYQLGNINSAIDTMRDCLVTQKNNLSAPAHIAQLDPVTLTENNQAPANAATVSQPILQSPFMAENPAVQKTKPAPSATTLPEDLAQLVAKADLGPAMLRPSTENDYSWQKGHLDLELRQLSISGDNVFSQDNRAYLAKLKTGCAGEFVAEASDALPAQGGKPAYQLVETACSGKNGDVITAIAFIAMPKGTVVFAAQSKADQGGEAIKARDAFLKAALQ